MNTPSFFETAPHIKLIDPLSLFLGATGDGVFEYSYLDVVKLAGHSCPTVACSYLMARKALSALYPDELPRRGEIRVEMRDREEQGVTGVIANVLSFITGAAGAGGFHGIGGRFARNGLLSFNADIENEVRFTRTDTGASVEANANAGVAVPSPSMRSLLMQAMQPNASTEQVAAFGKVWQDRVCALVVDHADNPRTIDILR